MCLLLKKMNKYAVCYLKQNKKGISFCGKIVFSFDAIETDDMIVKHEAFIGSHDEKFRFARGKKN